MDDQAAGYQSSPSPSLRGWWAWAKCLKGALRRVEEHRAPTRSRIRSWLFSY